MQQRSFRRRQNHRHAGSLRRFRRNRFFIAELLEAPGKSLRRLKSI